MGLSYSKNDAAAEVAAAEVAAADINSKKTIYCDGVFDMFHIGHVTHFKTIKERFPNSHLIVGVISDVDTRSYKKSPIMTENQRAYLVSKCRYVDTCVANSPLVVTEQFIRSWRIDYVIHAFSNDTDSELQTEFFSVPINMGIFKTIPYTAGVSSSMIRSELDWAGVWSRKGQENDHDLQRLGGYEDTDFNPVTSWGRCQTELGMSKDDSILEVGCGAGYLAQYITATNNEYVGVDYARSLVNRHIAELGHAVIQGEAIDLPFGDGSFDYVVCVGVLAYFDSLDYLKAALKEFERIARKGVYLGNVRCVAREGASSKNVIAGGETRHLIIGMEDLPMQYKCVDGFYDTAHYFNAFTRTA